MKLADIDLQKATIPQLKDLAKTFIPSLQLINLVPQFSEKASPSSLVGMNKQNLIDLLQYYIDNFPQEEKDIDIEIGKKTRRSKNSSDKPSDQEIIENNSDKVLDTEAEASPKAESSEPASVKVSKPADDNVVKKPVKKELVWEAPSSQEPAGRGRNVRVRRDADYYDDSARFSNDNPVRDTVRKPEARIVKTDRVRDEELRRDDYRNDSRDDARRDRRDDFRRDHRDDERRDDRRMPREDMMRDSRSALNDDYDYDEPELYDDYNGGKGDYDRNPRDDYYQDYYEAPPRPTSGIFVTGVLDILPDGYGFLRGSSYKNGSNDIHIAGQFIKKYMLRIGDMITGIVKAPKFGDSFFGLQEIVSVNGLDPKLATRRPKFEHLIPIFPQPAYKLESENGDFAARLIDIFSPIGRGQRGLLVSPPKAGKTTILKKIADGIAANIDYKSYEDYNADSRLKNHLFSTGKLYNKINKNKPPLPPVIIALLVDERPEEVTDMDRSIKGEVIASTFDESPEQHVHVSQLVMERTRRLVEMGRDVVLLLDSLTRMSRAFNNFVPPTGRTLTGGLDVAALRIPKSILGSARNIENGGSLTVIATVLIETNSKMDDVIYEEFKGTANMEFQLDRKLAERRIFPAIDILKSSTRHDELLHDYNVLEAVTKVCNKFKKTPDVNPTEAILDYCRKFETNEELFENWFDQMKIGPYAAPAYKPGGPPSIPIK